MGFGLYMGVGVDSLSIFRIIVSCYCMKKKMILFGTSCMDYKRIAAELLGFVQFLCLAVWAFG